MTRQEAAGNQSGAFCGREHQRPVGRSEGVWGLAVGFCGLLAAIGDRGFAISKVWGRRGTDDCFASRDSYLSWFGFPRPIQTADLAVGGQLRGSGHRRGTRACRKPACRLRGLSREPAPLTAADSEDVLDTPPSGLCHRLQLFTCRRNLPANGGAPAIISEIPAPAAGRWLILRRGVPKMGRRSGRSVPYRRGPGRNGVISARMLRWPSIVINLSVIPAATASCGAVSAPGREAPLCSFPSALSTEAPGPIHVGKAGVSCLRRSRPQRNRGACRFPRCLHLETDEPLFPFRGGSQCSVLLS